MSLYLKTTDELEAVNTMLSVIGEQPVNQLTGSGITEANTARQILHQTSRETQSIGLNCNTDYNHKYHPDTQGNIYIPVDVINVDATDTHLKVAQRGQRLYDRDKHTFVFDKPIELDTVTFLQFNDLPQTAKDFITIKAARRFARRELGSTVIDGLTEQDEYEAKHIFFAAEVDKGDYTIFDANDAVTEAMRRI